MNEIEFQQQFKAAGPPTLAGVLGRAVLPDRAELEEDRAAKVAAAAAAVRREELALANAASGDPLGELSRAQSVMASARDVVRDLESRLVEARRTLAVAEENVAIRIGQADDVMTQVARRSSGDDDLLTPAKAAHLEFVQTTRAAFAAVQARTPRRPVRSRRPFVGEVSRSEVTCAECIAAGATAEESFLIHADPSPGPVPDSWAAEEQAERRGYGRAREIVR